MNDAATEAPRSYLVVRNPAARRAPSTAALTSAIARLRQAGHDIDVHSTSRQGEATAVAREAAARGVFAVLACGGDGTVREVVEGLAHTSTALGVLPAGTANVWAHEARIPLSLGPALALAVRGRRVLIDTGLVNGHRFLLMCSAGLDASTVHAMEGSRAKRNFGRVAYAFEGVRRAAQTPGQAATIEVDGAPLERDLLMAVAGNSRLFGMVAQVTSRAVVDDGLLDLCLISADRTDTPARRLAVAWAALRGGLPHLADRGRPGIDYVRAERVRIDARAPLDVQADGDWIGQTPVTIEADAASLWVLVPPGPNPLWTG
ncbi:MAG: YegS/Rv2252/BmrU family lipid kinase [Dehalococcoidia bacterium]|nr:YegS/Rv2252/BmrU family lipid kinase [Dehalococcoidia bacterium]